MITEMEQPDKTNELCTHDWRMEPAWRLISCGQCRKCKTIKVFQNKLLPGKRVRRKRARGQRQSTDICI